MNEASANILKYDAYLFDCLNISLFLLYLSLSFAASSDHDYKRYHITVQLYKRSSKSIAVKNSILFATQE